MIDLKAIGVTGGFFIGPPFDFPVGEAINAQVRARVTIEIENVFTTEETLKAFVIVR